VVSMALWHLVSRGFFVPRDGVNREYDVPVGSRDAREDALALEGHAHVADAPLGNAACRQLGVVAPGVDLREGGDERVLERRLAVLGGRAP